MGGKAVTLTGFGSHSDDVTGGLPSAPASLAQAQALWTQPSVAQPQVLWFPAQCQVVGHLGQLIGLPGCFVNRGPPWSTRCHPGAADRLAYLLPQKGHGHGTMPKFGVPSWDPLIAGLGSASCWVSCEPAAVPCKYTLPSCQPPWAMPSPPGGQLLAPEV